jgi:hypothetical protein
MTKSMRERVCRISCFWNMVSGCGVDFLAGKRTMLTVLRRGKVISQPINNLLLRFQNGFVSMFLFFCGFSIRDSSCRTRAIYFLPCLSPVNEHSATLLKLGVAFWLVVRILGMFAEGNYCREGRHTSKFFSGVVPCANRFRSARRRGPFYPPTPRYWRSRYTGVGHELLRLDTRRLPEYFSYSPIRRTRASRTDGMAPPLLQRTFRFRP